MVVIHCPFCYVRSPLIHLKFITSFLFLKDVAYNLIIDKALNQHKPALVKINLLLVLYVYDQP